MDENRWRRVASGVLLAVMVQFVVGCSKATFAEAKKRQERGEYYEAAALYRKIYAKTSARERTKRGEIAFEMGLCYREINLYTRAGGAFQNAVRYGVNDSVASFRLAQMLHAQGRYPQAEKQYDVFLARNPRSQLARNGLHGVQLARQWRAAPTRYVVRRESLLNSRRADFSPMLAGEDYDQLYITSSNDKFTKEITRSGITGMKDNDIFLSKKNERGEWAIPQPIDSDLNSEADEGTPSVSPDGLTMYLSRATKSDRGETTVVIAVSRRSGGKWGKATPIELLGDSTHMAAHPAVSPAGDWLYFVSDKPGGYGGKDIWRAAITPTGFGEAENLGSRINTAADEVFPYVRSNGELYFASDGHPGMGGLDLFRACPTDDGGWRVENMQHPVNSSGDDFGITFAGNAEEGFFSSNRTDARGWDHLYRFRLPTVAVYMQGFVVDKEDEMILSSTIRIVGNDGTIIRTQPKNDGSYRVKLDYGRDYVMQATAPNFLSASHQFTTPDRNRDTVYVHDFILTPTRRPVVVDNIFYEFDSAELLPQSTVALDSLVGMMNEHPYIRIELGAHTDRKGSDVYNEQLSLKRARSVVEFLIAHGVAADRLDSKGYGKREPKRINKKIAALHPDFLQEGDTLTEAFVDRLTPEQLDIADQLNRRTEFRIVSTSYNLR